MNQQAIGVFDSGMGGLTVLKALKQALPQENFIYLGDTARLPYGTKSIDTIRQYAQQMASALIARNIKMLVIACNSATAAALHYLQCCFRELTIIGVIEPGAQAAIYASKTHHIGVLATEATLQSGIYQKTIQQLAPDADVIVTPCSLFVALAEEGCIDDAIADAAIKKYLSPIINNSRHPDCILLGCTHFPVLLSSIRAFLPEDITIVNSATTVAQTVKQAIEKNHLHNTQGQVGTLQYLVTDLPERFARIGQLFLGHSIDLNTIEIINP